MNESGERLVEKAEFSASADSESNQGGSPWNRCITRHVPYYSEEGHMKMPWIGWIVLVAAFLSPLAARSQTQTLVLDGGTVIDGTGRNPITNAVVVVEGNRITAVGSQGQVPVPQNAKIIKTDGRYILP